MNIEELERLIANDENVHLELLQRRAEKYVRRIHYRIQFGQHAGNPV